MLKILLLFLSLIGFVSTCAADGKRKFEPTRFENHIVRYEEIDQRDPPPPSPILFLGSSSIVGWQTLENDMLPLRVLNRGFGGSVMKDVLYYFDRIVTPYQPQKIVIYEGDNDTAHGLMPLQFLQDCQHFVAKVHAQLPNTKVYFLAIKPSIVRYPLLGTVRQTNRLLATYAKQHDLVEFIDVHNVLFDAADKLRVDVFVDDNAHLNATGYALWTKVVKSYISLH